MGVHTSEHRDFYYVYARETYVYEKVDREILGPNSVLILKWPFYSMPINNNRNRPDRFKAEDWCGQIIYEPNTLKTNFLISAQEYWKETFKKS